MEKKQETKKNKSLVKKAKKIRSVIMMTLLCVLMMSAATYAWFTLSNTAKISNMTMTVGDVTGLQIAPDNNGVAGEYGSIIDMTDILKGEGVLLPATSTDGKTFSKPSYDDNGEVSGVTTTNEVLPLSSTADQKGYYIEYKFWLKSLGDDAEVKLKKGSNIPVNGKFPDASATNQPTGTYVLLTSDATDSIKGSAAIRMSFSTSEATSAAVYEPNVDVSDKKNEGTATRAKDKRETKAAVTTTIPQKFNGEIQQVSNSYNNVVSLVKGVEKQIILRIWIEGTDDQCSNEIAMKNLKAQLQFTTDADPNSTSQN